MRWFFLLFALTVNAAASILMKVGSKHAQNHPLAADAGLASRAFHFLNFPTVFAMVLFAVNVLAYRKALDEFDLSIAYPIMVSGALVLVTAAACLIPMFSERLYWWQVVGMVLIGAGIWLLLYSPSAATR